MARRRRGQFPEPKEENGQWKIRYWADETQDDGSRKRIRKTKCLGTVEEITLTQAKKEARFEEQTFKHFSPAHRSSWLVNRYTTSGHVSEGF